MTDTTERPDPDERGRLLGIYLNDHLAGATGGVELARRVADAQRGSEHGPELARVADEIAADRDTLLSIMGRLGVPVRQYKVYLGWVAEKAGRLKSNGTVFRRSPLSSVVELEGLAIGIRGKIAGWRTLTAVAEHDDRVERANIDALITRADHQLDSVEVARMDAVTDLFGRPG